jgi:hypothetical protein
MVTSIRNFIYIYDRSALGALVNLSILPRVKTTANIPLVADCLSSTPDKECVRYAILCLKNLSSVGMYHSPPILHLIKYDHTESNKKIMQGASVVGKLVQRVWDGSGGTQWGASAIASGGILSEPDILRAAFGTLSRLVDCEGVDDEFREQVRSFYVSTLSVF